MARTEPTPHETRDDKIETPERTDPAAAGMGAAATGVRVPGRGSGTTTGAEYDPDRPRR